MHGVMPWRDSGEDGLQSKTFGIQEIDLGIFGEKEVMCENQLNDDHCITEDDGDAYVNVHDEILNASHRDLHENAARVQGAG